MAAEVGAMNVTEQVDAIRAPLGGDPAKEARHCRAWPGGDDRDAAPQHVRRRPRDPLGAMFVCSSEYDIRPTLFLQTALESVLLTDLFSGLAKTPVFGFIIAIVGCHFGLTTQGGTEGRCQSTTRTVVVVSIAILDRRLLPDAHVRLDPARLAAAVLAVRVLGSGGVPRRPRPGKSRRRP